MKYSFSKHAILISALVGFGGSASATQPPDSVVSDANWDTAMGTGALHSLSNGGSANTASGYSALYNNTDGYGNTASGYNTLVFNTTGYYNTATGFEALYFNETGNFNTASGFGAMTNNQGSNNSGFGAATLYQNRGDLNTAVGNSALFQNDVGSKNTAAGAEALTSNTGGSYNTASGYQALYSNTTGSYNTASGTQALYSNATGIRNTADGDWALYSNTDGNDNTASGQGALYSTSGNKNLAVGYNSGYYVTSGSYNIEIGNEGTSSDYGMIRIGTSGFQTETFIAGISNSQVTGAVVYVTSSGKLGVLASSERYKTAITPMGTNTEKLQQLRPVIFHLKSDPKGALQYGLIAEEVDKVYPELVIRDEAGKIQGVRYDELAPMLLNEVQKQQRINESQAAEIRDLKKLVIEMQAGLLKLQAKDELLAQR